MGNLMLSKKRILASSPHILTESGSLAHFETDMVAPVKSAKVYFEPVQEGSGDPSPDNVRAINGWNKLNIQKTKKNILNFLESEMISDGWNRFFPNPFTKPGTYVLSCQNKFGAVNKEGCVIHAKNETYNSSNVAGIIVSGYNFGGTVFSAVVTITEEIAKAPYIMFGFLQSGTTFESIQQANLMIEVGQNTTSYEVYNGQTISLDWTNDYGTIYGGYVDLINGELIAEYGIVDLGTLPWHEAFRYGEGFFMCYASAFSAAAATNWIGLSDKYPCYDKTYQYLKNVTCGITRAYVGQNGTGIAIKDASITLNDLETMKAGLSGVNLVYQLLDPIHYSLSPAQLKTFRGINNIWSDSNGPIEIKYWTH